MAKFLCFLVLMGTLTLALAAYPFCSPTTSPARPMPAGHVGVTDFVVKIYSRFFPRQSALPVYGQLCSGIALDANLIVTTRSCLYEGSIDRTDSVIVAGGWVSPARPFELELKKVNGVLTLPGPSGLSFTALFPGFQSEFFDYITEETWLSGPYNLTNGTQVLLTGWGQVTPGHGDAVYAQPFVIIGEELMGYCDEYDDFDLDTMLCAYKEGPTEYSNVPYPGGPVVVCDESRREVLIGFAVFSFADKYTGGTLAFIAKLPNKSVIQEFKGKLSKLLKSG